MINLWDLCIKVKQVKNRGIAQLVEHRSPKPSVVSSNLTAPANKKRSPLRWPFLLAIGEVDENSRGSEFDYQREAGQNAGSDK